VWGPRPWSFHASSGKSRYPVSVDRYGTLKTVWEDTAQRLGRRVRTERPARRRARSVVRAGLGRHEPARREVRDASRAISSCLGRELRGRRRGLRDLRRDSGQLRQPRDEGLQRRRRRPHGDDHAGRGRSYYLLVAQGPPPRDPTGRRPRASARRRRSRAWQGQNLTPCP
jgi:hypothetical protein